MSQPLWNFSPGPATLPRSVLERVQRELVELPGLGISPLEVSHRSPWFEGVIRDAEANLRDLLGIPDSHAVIFCPGGASLQFSMVAVNLLRGRPEAAAYVLTGSWGERALAEAETEGTARTAWSGAADGYVRVPAAGEIMVDPGAAYLHLTTNETIQGVEFPSGAEPDLPRDVPLVADASSDLLSRPIPVERYGLLYAGAQKNAGPAGVTLAILRRDLLGRAPGRLPSMLDYRTYVEHGSLFNTPPVFAIYVLALVTAWLRDEVGGLDRQEKINREKADLVYAEVDRSDGFYRGHAEPASRSRMNVTFRLPSESLERHFVTDADAEGLMELKGHRSVGGVRASLYNAMPVAGAEALAGFMRRFAASNG
jgi:phosphoserine aminotransferase